MPPKFDWRLEEEQEWDEFVQVEPPAHSVQNDKRLATAMSPQGKEGYLFFCAWGTDSLSSATKFIELQKIVRRSQGIRRTVAG